MEYFEHHDGKRMLCRTENFLDYHLPLKTFITVKLNNVCGSILPGISCVAGGCTVVWRGERPLQGED